MSDVLIVKNARVIDPASARDFAGAVLVANGVIADIVEGGAPGVPEGARVIDARGAVLAPGLVDLRANLGEPGYEYRETIISAAAAAAAGGITTLAALPDTKPAIDDPALVHLLRARGEQTGSLTILPYGALTRDCLGEEMAELGLLHEAGAVAFTDGRRAIANARLMRLALSYTRFFGAPIVQHPEDPVLAGAGVATEGELASRLGLPGIPPAAEAIMVARDLRLAELTSGQIHFAHISTGEALDLIRAAKSRGIRVTCDTAPPYFDLNETAIGAYRSYARLSPPLRAECDRWAVVAGLADGTIDAIASDHQPLDADDTQLPFAQSPPGGTGLATLLAVTLAQVHSDKLTLLQALALLTCKPASVLGIAAGQIAKGKAADMVLFDPERAWQIKSGFLPGKAQNTPFDGRAVEGQVIATFKNGSLVFGQ
jgi:dihydroorotase